jgi:3-phosphoglycerate kinase
MVDTTRYQESLPLIKELSKQSKALLITAHLGRPKNNESEFSLIKIAKKLESDL